ncbi:hypothetical protein A1D15_0119 [Lactiplantibacillus plantarum]|uniref:Cation/H+ exchanger transmembrane domain-containing protein n=1 Tax=Lactiplantibacillus plantarum TaxID=1590 RepID=A0AAW3RB30_LACPN|nr:hypothetical protein A1D15_0119 [Lactiplantibacillus plantarum]KZU99667.1 hypothetical protein NAB1_2287 [Lactiplantibacillus plantarum]KZV01531.1 hypothetical protein NAB2_2151 [Lactiplantibacillus plantarum]
MDQVSLVIILLAALLIPLIMAKFKINSLPTAVMEIIVGIVIGPSVFNFVNTSDLISQLSTIGVIVLLFLSGLEIDFSLFKKRRTALTPLEQKTRSTHRNIRQFDFRCTPTAQLLFYRCYSPLLLKSAASSVISGLPRFYLARFHLVL